VIVAKVGGSLYDLPRLGPTLGGWLAKQPEPVLLVPGGGGFADVVRKLDQIHKLGDETAHWLAIRSMTLAGAFLAQVLPPQLPAGCAILDPFPFFQKHDAPTHSWLITSDTLALQVALRVQASKLVLLKSVEIPPHTSWQTAAQHGWVDPYFPKLAEMATVPIEIVNFRGRFEK
jgi:5-(aminomethyl)-3-furanmethanol phosphate kinase